MFILHAKQKCNFKIHVNDTSSWHDHVPIQHLTPFNFLQTLQTAEIFNTAVLNLLNNNIDSHAWLVKLCILLQFFQTLLAG